MANDHIFKGYSEPISQHLEGTWLSQLADDVLIGEHAIELDSFGDWQRFGPLDGNNVFGSVRIAVVMREVRLRRWLSSKGPLFLRKSRAIVTGAATFP